MEWVNLRNWFVDVVSCFSWSFGFRLDVGGGLECCCFVWIAGWVVFCLVFVGCLSNFRF